MTDHSAVNQSQSNARSGSPLQAIGDFRWVRAHVSTFAVGSVVLVVINLIAAGPRLWSLTAIGIWAMLLLVHLVLLAITRLARDLLADDEDEIVLLPLQEAVFVAPSRAPEATWADAQPPAENTPPDPTETVSWQIATNAAQVRKSGEPSGEPSA